MTPQQIAEKVFPNVSTSPQKRKHKELIQLITTLQKETWDQACKAQREIIEKEFELQGLEFPRFRHFPYAPMPENL